MNSFTAIPPSDFTQVLLVTPRLRLRPLRCSDADDMFNVYSDPQVMRYGSSPVWSSVNEAITSLTRTDLGMRTGQFLRLALTETEHDRFIGDCCLFKFDHQCRHAEVGYSLGADYWGRGYMHEALIALLNYGFDALNLHRVEADVDPQNIASLNCLERLGFIKEGFLRERWIVNGVLSDTTLLGLLRREWTHAN
ncbi:GNAT family N-acetyltransferase [Undibacterium sp. RuRC25W]|uniref:GNAT family N-acetyltransferase n=1 Tax=Undibacterium sp. RuRC25W TaxID=3413047 RepID=UPI003BF44D66